MSVEDTLSTVQYIGAITEMATSLGVHLRVGTNFDEFRDIPKSQPQRAPIAPIFDPDFSDISSSNGFWVSGCNDVGEIVHTQAMCLIDLSGSNLAEHMQTRLGDYRPHGDKINADQSHCILTPAASAITGKVAYHGELWLKGGPNGYRGGCLAAILPRLVLATSLLRWPLDFIIGIMEPIAVCRGLAAREGYMHVEQHSILWNQPGASVPFEEWIVWMSGDDARFNLRVPPETLRELFETAGPKAPSIPKEAA